MRWGDSLPPRDVVIHFDPTSRFENWKKVYMLVSNVNHVSDMCRGCVAHVAPDVRVLNRQIALPSRARELDGVSTFQLALTIGE